MLLLTATPAIAETLIVPDAVKTPGDILTTDVNIICKRGYTKTVRNVPPDIKKLVYWSYGIFFRQPREYEIDHLISLELGGSNSIRNLWPESYVTQPLNAHVKDQLENRLHELICTNQLPVEQAQREIAENWLAAYEKYIGPLPGTQEEQQQHREPVALTEDDAPVGSADETSASVAPDEAGGCPASASIKVSKRGIYHLPGDPNYDRTLAKHCFSSSAVAEDAGFRAPK